MSDEKRNAAVRKRRRLGRDLREATVNSLRGDVVSAVTIFAVCASDLEAHLALHGSTQKPAYRMGLPAGPFGVRPMRLLGAAEASAGSWPTIMAKPGNTIHIPLSEGEAVTLLGRVKPTADMPRPGANPTGKKKTKKEAPKR
jgi:hypothetical protein